MRARKLAATVAIVTILCAAAWYWNTRAFRVRNVVAGTVFRASQPPASAFQELASENGIRTVINLRGANPKKQWYRDESDAASRAGIRLVDLRTETFDWPPRIETLKLIDALDHAPRPILIHCESGLDRSGWASAVARTLAGEPSERALEELSPWKGHFCRHESCALHQFFELYREWIATAGLPDSRDSFVRWARQAYYPRPYSASIVLESSVPPAVEPGSRISLKARVTNRSPDEWLATADKTRGIRFGARLVGPLDKRPADPLAAFRTPHTEARDVFRDGMTTGVWRPRGARVIDIAFDAPSQPGRYLVQLDMVDEGIHWFSDLGDGGVVVELNVRR